MTDEPPVTRPDLDALIDKIGRASRAIYLIADAQVAEEVSIILKDAAAALAAERSRADHAAEKAWDEGYMAVPAEPEDREFFVEDAPNPYRAIPTANQTTDSDRCPSCRHAEHDGFECLNMASDNDCACTHVNMPTATR